MLLNELLSYSVGQTFLNWDPSNNLDINFTSFNFKEVQENCQPHQDAFNALCLAVRFVKLKEEI